MDENVPGPSSSSDAPHNKASTSDSSWSSFASVPAPLPPTPFGHGSSGRSENGEIFHVNGDAGGDEVEEEDDLDTLLFGSTSFLSQEHLLNDEDNLDSLLYGSASLSLAAGKDEEVSMAFQEAAKDDSSALMFRAISESEPEVPLNGHHQNGSSNTHVFTVTSASPSPANSLSGEGSKPKPDGVFHCSKPLSNNQRTNIHPEDEDDERSSSSLQNHITVDDIPIISSNSQSQSDSGGISEEDARISSGPYYSTASHIPEREHTLSDISGPCSSSLVDRVPASFIEGDDDDDNDDERGSTCGAAKIAGEKELSHQLEITASTSASALMTHLWRSARPTELIPRGSTTTSTSSLSDSDEENDRVLSRCGSLKDQDGLPFPPPPPFLQDEGEEAVPMTVDTCEDYWTRLHDIRINGCILEYTGIGKSIHDNGFAQSNVPLTPLNHYFEITILDPGEYCYISIGLARQDYAVHKNPGWCRGSIAYHADDGKIFIGGGVGTPFGPRCTSSDVLGCGILFPDKYGELSEGSSWPWEVNEPEKENGDTADKSNESAKPRLPSRHHRRKIRVYSMDNFGDMSSSSEDDIWWNNKNQVCEDKVKVFFMRNQKLLGIKEVRIPKGGFYPTIGMMSTNERVSVDLHPLTG